MGSTTENDEIVTKLFGALARHDPDEIAEFFADDAVFHPVPGMRLEGKAAIRGMFAQFGAALSDVRVDIHTQMAAGSVVMNERTDHLTMGDNAMVLKICGVFELEDGLVTAWRDYYLDPVEMPSA